MKDSFASLLPLLLLLLLLRPVAGGFQCRDANGDPLDWFAMLKQPDNAEYAYVTSRAPDAWIQPAEADLTKSGPVAATLNQIFDAAAGDTADVLAAYNDERPPVSAAKARARAWSTTFGHMKGVVALKAGQNGFWLIHSVPKFPDLSQKQYTYPHTGIMYGQSFLCITVDSSTQANAIGKQLFASHPDLYNITVSPAALDSWPSWADLSQRKPPPPQLYNSTAQLLTSGGLQIIHLAKSAHLQKDLYSYLLAGQLDSSIQVESWQHGGGLMNSTCGLRYNVTKVLRVRIGSSMPEFHSTSDHSKWAVSTGAKPYVCIGDMNRADSQTRRGGGIACMSLAGPHGLFRRAVLSDQPCDSGVRIAATDCASKAEASRGTNNSEQRMVAMFNWAMVAAACAVACTLASAMMLVRLVVIARDRGGGKQYLVL